MKVSKKVISASLAAVMAASTLAVGGISASAASVKAPKKVTVANEMKGIKVTWSKVSGAKKYYVYRGSKKIATTKKTKYKDISVNAGAKVTYKVKAVKGKAVSTATKSDKITRLNKSWTDSVTNTASGVKITWSNKKGADTYRIYRKTTGSFKKIATTTKKTYTDKTVVSGTKYTYKVVAYAKSTKDESPAYKKSITYVAQVQNVSALQTASCDGISLSWSAVSGADSYTVYRQKSTAKSFSEIATVTSTSYTNSLSKVDNPTAYKYIIVANKNSSSSAYSAERFTLFLPKDAGINRYYYDEDNNAYVQLFFSVGDVYSDGKACADYLGLNGMYQVNITEGSDVVSIEDGVITATASGTAVAEVTFSDSAKSFASIIDNKTLNALSTKTLYLLITVA